MNDNELERLLKALANKRRVSIIRILVAKGEMTVGALAEHIKLSFKSTSRHLSVLISAGILDREQRSLSVFYKIAPDMSKISRNLISLL